MAAPGIGEKIILNFGWEGPSRWRGGWSHGGLDVDSVGLEFKGAKTAISVDIPDNISTIIAQKLPFTCRRYHEAELELNSRAFKPVTKETHPDSLKVTVEQIRTLRVKAVFFEESPRKGPAIMDSSGQITREKYVLRLDREVKLKLPEELEIGQTYTLVVTSNDLSLSARLTKEERFDDAMEAEKKARRVEISRRMRNMGGALVEEGMQNLDLASKGGIPVFDSSSTSADVFSHGMQGIIRAGQHMHPGIEVPHSKHSEGPLDLDVLTAEELQSRFEVTYKEDKEFESQSMQMAMAGNIEEMNKIIEAEQANSQLLINLVEALERKGIKAQIPQSESFQAAVNESAEAHAEALEDVKELCKVQ